MKEPQIKGNVEPGFEPVLDAFRENFTRRRELGAGFCAFLDGRPVVDLWGGLADAKQGRPWEEDTLCMIFSSTKGLVATAFLMLADRGLIDYDAPLADHWPELAKNGKASITLRQLMNHRSGLIALDAALTIDDFESWDPVLAAMEAQEPLWEPGSSQGYHGVTFGPYLAEIFRRVTGGDTLGRFIQSELAGPLGADVHLGLPEADDERVATLYPVTMAQRFVRALPYVLFNDVVERRLLRAMTRKRSDTARAFGSPAQLGAKGLQNFNLPRVRRLELPWANGLATARGLATVYSALSTGGSRGGVRVCGQETLAPVQERQSFEPRDRVILKPVGWSQGFIKEETHLFSPNPESFGHPGMGGALGFCDPTRRVSWAYVMNRLDFRLRSPRALALSHALYKSLDAA